MTIFKVCCIFAIVMVKRKCEDVIFKDPLVDMRRGAHVTGVGTEKILRYVRDHGLPRAISGPSQTRAVAKAMKDMSTICGPLLQEMPVVLEDGTKEVTFVANPWTLLFLTVTRCAPFRRLLREKFRQTPCSFVKPWGSIIYFDEVSPRTR